MSARPEKQMDSHALADTSAVNETNDYMLGAVLLVVAVLVTWYFEIPLIFDLWSPDFNPLIVMMIVLGGVGVAALARAVRATIRVRKFGTSTLAPPIARVGGLYRGTLRTSRDLSPSGDYQVTLKCMRRYRSRSDSDGKSNSSERVVHKERKTIPAGGQSSLGLPVEFMIPNGLPRSGSTKKDPDGQVRWVLTVTAPMRGVNYYAKFAIQVS